MHFHLTLNWKLCLNLCSLKPLSISIFDDPSDRENYSFIVENVSICFPVIKFESRDGGIPGSRL